MSLRNFRLASRMHASRHHEHTVAMYANPRENHQRRLRLQLLLSASLLHLRPDILQMDIAMAMLTRASISRHRRPVPRLRRRVRTANSHIPLFSQQQWWLFQEPVRRNPWTFHSASFDPVRARNGSRLKCTTACAGLIIFCLTTIFGTYAAILAHAHSASGLLVYHIIFIAFSASSSGGDSEALASFSDGEHDKHSESQLFRTNRSMSRCSNISQVFLLCCCFSIEHPVRVTCS